MEKQDWFSPVALWLYFAFHHVFAQARLLGEEYRCVSFSEETSTNILLS